MLFVSINSHAFEVDGVLKWAGLSIKSFSSPGIVKIVSVRSGEVVNKDKLLAQLDLVTFKIEIEKHKSRAGQLDSLIFDARVDFDNAKELFDRTVLSEIDLQKKKGVLQGLKAQQAAILADLKLAQQRHKDAKLISPYDARVIQVNILSGMVISEENKSEAKIMLAQQGRMQAAVIMDVEQALKVKLGQEVTLNINGNQHQGRVMSFSQHSVQGEQYIFEVEFNHDVDKSYLAGQKAKVKF